MRTKSCPSRVIHSRASLDWQLLNKQNCSKIIDKIENKRKG